MIIAIKNKIIKRFACPIICVLFTFGVLLFIKSSKNYQQDVVSNDSIQGQIDIYLNKCKEDYWVSWLTIENGTYYYQDVRGYNPYSDKNKVYSVKEKSLNPKYTRQHDIDQNSFNLVKGYETGLVGFYDIEELKPYTAVYTALTDDLNVSMKKVAISITRNSFKRLIYVFAFTVSKEEMTPCNRTDIVKAAKNISIYAKQKL